MYQRTISNATKTVSVIKASGIIIQVESSTFLALLEKLESPLVVQSQVKSILSEKNQYMTNYKGFILYAEDKQLLKLPDAVELIHAESIWLPG